MLLGSGTPSLNTSISWTLFPPSNHTSKPTCLNWPTHCVSLFFLLLMFLCFNFSVWCCHLAKL
ncbi:hypothetical protein LDENG_00104980 [Lucifuga dentata]|nr:hypothetical protein LDENG_00104980 [Lucifuga dentata]